MYLFFVCLCDVEGACSKLSFYHVFGGSAEFCVVSWVVGWACLYDANYRCLVGKVGRFVWAWVAGCSGIDGCSSGWSFALGASFNKEV
jgi:hypothetical protein